jgi:glycerol-3-phosphate dehydrogenase
VRREEHAARCANGSEFDFIIVGGGASGLGCAVDAAARGYSVLLLEQLDFAKGTSSRSTKLVHGGVRYLQQGDITLVMDALRERGRLKNNAPHLVHDLAFVVPSYAWWQSPYYGIGLKIYDLLAGKQGFGPSQLLSRQATIDAIPSIETEGLRGGVRYFDGQFDDARLAIHLARTAAEHGALLQNYMRVTGLLKEDGVVRGVEAWDVERRLPRSFRARAVINATGVWADDLRRQETDEAKSMIRPSQGVHIVLDKRFLPGDTAIMVPQTEDGRVLFAIPWHDRVVVGTTDTPIEDRPLEPRALPEELEFILFHAQKYLSIDPSFDDIKSIYAGVRPLVSSGDGKTSSVSRDHTLQVGPSRLITLAGGKWTTYRKMAEDTIDHAARVAELEARPCPTAELPIHGSDSAPEGPLWFYGSDGEGIRALMDAEASLAEPLHQNLPTRRAEVVWATRYEMARTVEDVLARRTRALLFDAKAAIQAAPETARLMAKELGRDGSWISRQVETFREVAAGYLPEPATAAPAKVSLG